MLEELEREELPMEENPMGDYSDTNETDGYADETDFNDGEGKEENRDGKDEEIGSFFDGENEDFTPETEIYEEDGGEDETDYESVMRADLAELKNEFPELKGIDSVASLNNPLRYAALRDLGLSPREAYLASSYRPKAADNRSHLKQTASSGASERRTGMTRSELLYARELFSGLSDSEIYSLYKKVSV